jgi:hypothetical protein
MREIRMVCRASCADGTFLFPGTPDFGNSFEVVKSIKGSFVESKGLQIVQSGERTNTEGKPVSNIILLSVSNSDYSSLRPHLEYVSLPNHRVLHEGVESWSLRISRIEV